MKITIMFALSLSAACSAQEANPFVKNGALEPPEQLAGVSYVGIIEQILVPPDLIEGWLDEHGIPEDATGLRATVQEWIHDGRASCEHTSVGVGLAGNKAFNESILEQVYPTEYLPNGSGVWPLPTAFETRNVGHSIEFEPTGEGKGLHVVATGFSVEMLGSNSWHTLVEKTRHPDDVFTPVFRSFRLEEGKWVGFGDDPFASSGEDVPPAGTRRRSTMVPAAKPGGIALVSREDPWPDERKAGQRSRLVFLRGAVEEEIRKATPLPPRLHVSYKSLKVPHVAFSDWLQGRNPLEVPGTAWDFVRSLEGDQAPALLEAADGIHLSDGALTLESIREIIYPVEFKPSNESTLLERWEASKQQREGEKNVEGTGTFARYKVEAAPGLAGASLPTSFETRNTGVTLEMTVSGRSDDPWAKVNFERVKMVGESVYRRIEDQGNWIPDMTMPLFASTRCTAFCRLERGRWTLVSTGTEFTGPGKADRDHCLLIFVKVE